MTVRQIAQTPDGYLWLATSGGLMRFDGIHFTTYLRASGQSLDNCTVLMVDPDGSLWVATGSGVVAHFQSGQFRSYASQEGLPSDYIHALYRDSHGVLWVGTRDHGVFRMVNGRFEELPLGIPGLISGILEESNQSLWISTFGNGVFRLQNGKLASFSVKDGLPDNRLAGLYRDHSGRIWTFGSKGISSWNGKRFVGNPTVDSVVAYAAGCIEDRDGNLWIASTESGLVRMRDGHVTKMDASSGLSADFAGYVYEDKEGNIWVGTDAGLDRLQNAQVRAFNDRDGLFRVAKVFQWPVIDDRTAGVWTVAGNRIARVAEGRISIWPFAAPPDSKAHALLLDSDSGLLVGTARGIEHWSPARAGPTREMPELDVRCLLRAHDGSVWIGTANRGLLRWKSYPEFQTNLEMEIPDKSITTLAEDHNGTIWAGSHGGGLFRIDGRKVQHFGQRDGLPSSDVFTVFVDRQGALWIGSRGGLSWFQDRRIRTVSSEQGLRSDLVLSILDDSYDRIWFFGHVGIGAMEKKNLRDWAAGRLRQLNPVFYRSAEGLPPWTIDTAFPNAVQSVDGHLWFAYANGLAEVTPPNPATSYKFPVVIEEVTINGITHPASGRIQIPAGARSVQIGYTALTLSHSIALRFRYRLDRIDDDWVDADTRRIAFYSNLKPGAYTFRVQASAGQEQWLESSPLFLEQIPFFYQTKWFLLMVSATALSLIFLTYRLRLRLAVNRIEAGFQQRIDERLRIARELHDTLLQSFHGLMFQFQAARNMLPRKPENENAMKAMDEAILATEDAITEGRDAIRDLRPAEVTQRSLTELLNAMGRELAGKQELNGHSPSFRVLVEGRQRPLSRMLQDEVYRISREVIRNAYQHADASHIEVEIRYAGDQLRLRIRDDGKGIDPKILEAGGQPGHWGLPGIRERAQRMGSRLQFWSEVGVGTEVELTVPAAMAYEKRRNGRRFRLFGRAGGDGQRS